MRYLFVSGVHTGGAPRSTLELGRRLAERGHDLVVLLGTPHRENSPHDLLVRAWVKSQSVPGAGLPFKAAARRLGRRITPLLDRSRYFPVLECGLVENAYLRILDNYRPDVVVANSLPRAALQWITADLAERDIPLVLYLREAHAVTHVTVSGLRPAALIANAQAYVDQLQAVSIDATYIPSVVDCSAATTASTRERVVFVNPKPENDPTLVLSLAAARPDIPFLFQESWPLTDAERTNLETQIAPFANVELRSQVPSPAQVYADARLLLATYPGGRPRVVLEAHHNGIPVLALDQPALREAVGAGGALVAADAPASVWLEQLERIWDDDALYSRLVAASREHAKRPEVDPEQLTRRFERVTSQLVST